MKISNKILSIILAFVMVITMVLPVFAENYATSGTCGENVTWEFDVPTRTLTISGEGEITNNPWYTYQKIIKSVIIESGVTGLCTNAFEGCTALTNLVIGDTVTSIAHWAFEDCSSLTSVVIPDNVRVIEHSAFENCSSLVDITIGNNLKSISDNAFYGCYNLKNVYIKNLTNWCNISFAWYNNECDSNPLCYAKNLYLDGELIIDLIIPEDVTSINSYAFYNYNLLESVTIHENVTSIAESAFRDCDSLFEINVAENNSSFKSIDGVLFSKNMIALLLYPSTKTDETYVILDDVLIIKDYAFYNNNYLKDVKFSNTVATIGDYAFYDCDNLDTVVMGSGVTSIGSNAFPYVNTDLYYNGTEEQWKSVSIGYDNYFKNIHYNCSNPDGHYTLTKVVNPSTCADEGYSEYTCPCGNTLVKDYTYLEHTPGEWNISRNPTCIKTGFKYEYCTVCGDWLAEEEIPATGHTASEWQSIAPTCTESGLEGKCCTICGELLEGEIVAALGGSHTFGEWENVDNKNQRTCKTCGYVEYKIFLGDLDGDGYTSAVDARIILQIVAGLRECDYETPALVDLNGDGNVSAIDARMILQLVCHLREENNCNVITSNGDIIKEENISVNAADEVEVTVILAEKSGLGALTLDVIYDSTTFKPVEMKNGDFGAVVNANFADGKARTTFATATAFEDSGLVCTITFEALKDIDSTISVNVIESCDNDYNNVDNLADLITLNCVKIKVEEPSTDEPTIDKSCSNGYHTWSEWQITNVATCEPGTKVRNCIICSETEWEDIPATDEHTFAQKVYNPSCTSSGEKYDECIYCGMWTNTETIPSQGHNYTWYTISVATCETDGVMIGECSVCEDVDIIANAKLGHNFVNGVCQRCDSGEENGIEPEHPTKPEDTEFTFSIKEPSRISIRHKDGIVLHANIEGTLPEGAYIKWTTDNDNFDIEESTDGKSLTIISKNNGDTTITATVYDSNENILVTDTINMTSKAGFFDKIGSFFRSLFGGTEIYEN